MRATETTERGRLPGLRTNALIACLASAVIGLSSCGGSDSQLLERVDQLEREVDRLQFEATSTTTTSEAPSQDIRGTFTLRGDDDDVFVSDQACTGTGGYDDVRSGLDVVVRDASGLVVGASSLRGGELVNPDQRFIFDCAFKFEVSVPRNFNFYSIEVGSRGDLTFTQEELEEKGWVVAFTLG